MIILSIQVFMFSLYYYYYSLILSNTNKPLPFYIIIIILNMIIVLMWHLLDANSNLNVHRLWTHIVGPMKRLIFSFFFFREMQHLNWGICELINLKLSIVITKNNNNNNNNNKKENWVKNINVSFSQFRISFWKLNLLFCFYISKY